VKRRPMYLIVLLSGIGIAITLIYTWRVLAQQPASNALNEQQAWSKVGSQLLFMHVLQPTWLPPAFRQRVALSSDSWTGNLGGYGVSYCIADCFGQNATQLEFVLNPVQEHGVVDIRFPLRVRGTTGIFSIYRRGPTYEVSWHEAGQHYAVLGNNIWPSDLLKVAISLRVSPERRFPLNAIYVRFSPPDSSR
jgi:hypothetical protein